jgi:hypothetical protein
LADLTLDLHGAHGSTVVDKYVFVLAERLLVPEPAQLAMEMPPQGLLLCGTAVGVKSAAIVEPELHTCYSTPSALVELAHVDPP